MKQPEALRMADALDSDLSAEWMQGITLKHISDELRRLHEVNAELVEALNDLVNEIGDGFMPHKLFVDQALAALTKAQGENNG